ncbi:MAG: OsmC family protein [Intrasporangium sp.]|uniref:OsmC family protein n=1 Tax=Intrasporangium sp. TaxID=1925024 RepID=UPI0026483F32|nr:OsmC family protein [Intrasporangium sp.]MDN5797749.1 OsmC family protein [Intrasporangium sp.]
MSDHVYDVTLRWKGSTAAGYEGYERSHTVGPAGLEIDSSADPHFRGDPGLLNPEQLLVMAASSCQMLSFLAVAAYAHVDVLEYTDETTGLMPAGVRPTRITKVTLRPRITVAAGTDPALVARLVEKGHRGCFIANTLNAEMVIDPTIVVLDGEA